MMMLFRKAKRSADLIVNSVSDRILKLKTMWDATVPPSPKLYIPYPKQHNVLELRHPHSQKNTKPLMTSKVVGANGGLSNLKDSFK